MKSIGNIIWFLFAGLWEGLAWCVAGALWCITIVGIPIGKECFKLSHMVYFPFGKEIVYDHVGPFSMLANVLWILISGIPLALAAATNGILLCITIIGIPFGLQCFKFARLALAPFGATIVYE
jgi:uncharacterized membrane protein YccF (DUF307 family)